VELDLRPIGEFYEKHVVHLSTAGEVEPLSIRVDNTTYVPENDEYVLFVHGYNVPEYTTDRWAETVFKRLWWLGYKGHLGAFRWPEIEGLFCLSDPTVSSCYNKSDYRSWNSARALRYLLPDLDSRFPGQIRILAHSQGNTVVGEALRQLPTPLNLRYIAAQAAISALTYDNTIPPYPFHAPWHPDVYGHYYSGGTEDSEYFSGVLGGSARVFRYYNILDFALRSWRLNNELKANSLTQTTPIAILMLTATLIPIILTTAICSIWELSDPSVCLSRLRKSIGYQKTPIRSFPFALDLVPSPLAQSIQRSTGLTGKRISRALDTIGSTILTASSFGRILLMRGRIGIRWRKILI